MAGYLFEWDPAKAEPNRQKHDVTFDSEGNMSKKSNHHTSPSDRDPLRDEYDFSNAQRGVTAARYAEGSNVVVIDPEVLDVFPDGNAINEALRALAPVIRKQGKRQSV